MKKTSRRSSPRSKQHVYIEVPYSTPPHQATASVALQDFKRRTTEWPTCCGRACEVFWPYPPDVPLRIACYAHLHREMLKSLAEPLPSEDEE